MQMSEGKRVLIVLPDERRLELLVQPNLLSSDLLELVTSQVGLKEKEFFGLAFVDETYVSFLISKNDDRFLSLDRLSKQNKNKRAGKMRNGEERKRWPRSVRPPPVRWEL